jgi:hypothetical protein
MYKITDVDKFIEATRVLVYNNFDTSKDTNIDLSTTTINSLSKEEQKEIDEILTHQESMSIFLEFCKTKTNKKKTQEYYISEKKYLTFIESLNARMVSNMLSNMVRLGVIESAFDSEANDFVFWVKEDENKSKKNKKS